MLIAPRVNISNALTLKLPKDLGLKGMEPNVALTIFFVPYVLFEVPSNYFLKKLKPHVWRTLASMNFVATVMSDSLKYLDVSLLLGL